jgi:hypothetical protein
MIDGVEVFAIDENVELLFESPAFSIPEQKRKNVEMIWQAEKARRGDFIYDAPLLFLQEKNEKTIRSRFIQYKDFIALRRRPDLFDNQVVHTLGVSGLLISENCVFFAKRAHHVTGYAGWHELIPSGGIDETFAQGDGSIDFTRQLTLELKEEAGIDERHLTSKRPFVLIFDEADQTWDICVECMMSLPVDDAMKVIKRAKQNEYVDPVAVKIDDLSRFIAERKGKVVPTTLAMLEARKFITSSTLTG